MPYRAEKAHIKILLMLFKENKRCLFFKSFNKCIYYLLIIFKIKETVLNIKYNYSKIWLEPKWKLLYKMVVCRFNKRMKR